jgi:hypothetical protein
MERNKNPILLLFLISISLLACSTNKKATTAYTYKPDDQNLHNTIVRMDSLFFYAYNTCDVNLEQYGKFYAENVEFFHDKGGLMTSKQDIIDGTKRNVCGKVTRELIPGSIEVYPINNYGAIEMGLHKFHNKEEDESKHPSSIGKFIAIWQLQNNEWKITKVVSLH